MRHPIIALALTAALLGGCVQEPPGAGLPAGAAGSPLDASGRARAPFQGPAFAVGELPNSPGCLVIFTAGALVPLSLREPGQLVAIGGDCPRSFWQATASSAEALGLSGLIQVQGLGPCRLQQGPQRPNAAVICV